MFSYRCQKHFYRFYTDGICKITTKFIMLVLWFQVTRIEDTAKYVTNYAKILLKWLSALTIFIPTMK